MDQTTHTDASAQAKATIVSAEKKVRTVAESVRDAYAGHITTKRPPLAAYAGLAATFAGACGALLAAGARSRKLPRDVSTKDVALLAASTFFLAHTLTRDEVTSPLRAPFTTFQKKAGAGTVDEEPRGEGAQLAIGQLITCPYCVSPWIAATLATGLIVAPRATRTVNAVAASLALSYGLTQGYAAMKKLSE